MSCALPPAAKVIRLAVNAAFAVVARRKLEACHLGDVVETAVGRAVDSLARLRVDGAGPFDFVFIGADKASNPDDLRSSPALSRSGTLIVAADVVRDGCVPDVTDAPNACGFCRFVELVSAEPRPRAIAIEMVGGKGKEGFLLALVGRAPRAQT